MFISCRYDDTIMSRGSSVDIVTGYGLDYRIIGVGFLAEAGSIFLRHYIQTGCGAHRASYQWVPVLFYLGIKRPRREAIPELTLCVIMVWCLVKHWDKFSFMTIPLTDTICRTTITPQRNAH